MVRKQYRLGFLQLRHAECLAAKKRYTYKVRKARSFSYLRPRPIRNAEEGLYWASSKVPGRIFRRTYRKILELGQGIRENPQCGRPTNPARAPMRRLPHNTDFALLGALFVVCLASPSTIKASILSEGLPAESFPAAFSNQDLEKDLERLQGSMVPKQSQGTSGKTTSREPLYPLGPSDHEGSAPENANFSPNSGSASSTTSSGSSISGAGGSPFAALATQAPAVWDDPPVQRYAAERALLLPEAPGLELLRPPQM